MESVAQTALVATIPIYLIMMCGWMCRRLKWVTPEQDSAFMRISFDLFYPCFIFKAMLENELLRDVSFSLTVIGTGLLEIVLSIAIAFLITHLLGFKVFHGKRTITLTTGVQNYAYMVIPIVLTLYPNDGTLGVLLTHNVGLEIGLWSLGLLVLSENFHLTWRIFLRGPIIATFLALIIMWTGADKLLPNIANDTITQTLTMLGGCAVPLGLFLVGTTFYDLLGSITWSPKVVFTGIFIRNIILPICLIAAAIFIPFNQTLKQVILLQACVPAAMVPIVLSRYFGGQPAIAIQVVSSSTLLSLITLPLWLSIGITLLSQFSN